MPVAVVRVRPMAVGVLPFRMNVPVAMGLFRDPRVGVVVVEVAVDVGMRVGQKSVGMDMDVFFPRDKEGPGCHEGRRRSDGPREGLSEKQERGRGARERG